MISDDLHTENSFNCVYFFPISNYFIGIYKVIKTFVPFPFGKQEK